MGSQEPSMSFGFSAPIYLRSPPFEDQRIIVKGYILFWALKKTLEKPHRILGLATTTLVPTTPPPPATQIGFQHPSTTSTLAIYSTDLWTLAFWLKQRVFPWAHKKLDSSQRGQQPRKQYIYTWGASLIYFWSIPSHKHPFTTRMLSLDFNLLVDQQIHLVSKTGTTPHAHPPL